MIRTMRRGAAKFGVTALAALGLAGGMLAVTAGTASAPAPAPRRR